MTARSKFGASVDYLPAETISDVFDMVQSRTADYGVLPIENSTEGAVTHPFDRFATTTLKICAEIYQPVSHHLMSNSGRDSLSRIYSHSQVPGQPRPRPQRSVPCPAIGKEADNGLTASKGWNYVPGRYEKPIQQSTASPVATRWK